MGKSKKKTESNETTEKTLNPSASENVMEQIEKASGRLHALFVQLPRFLKVTRNDALSMHREIDDSSRVKSLSYWMFVVSSCGIATLGLIINSPAVIIGAMLVSPLMSPIIGLGMGIAVSDLYLGFKSILNIGLSVLVAVLTAFVITWIVPIQEMTPEILSRTSPTVLDLFIALFCGLVAALSSVRASGESLLSSAAPGAAIGVALMPPLCVTGYGIGIGFDQSIVFGAGLLFITNLTAIVLVSSIFFYFIYENYNIKKLIQLLTARREKSEPLFKLLNEVPAWNRLNGQITSGKRFLFPVGLLLLISYPLFISLGILKQKNDVRTYITNRLSEIDGMNVIRGADSLVYSSEGVRGSIVYSSTEVPPADFNDSLNRSVEKNFDSYRSKVSLVRVARESDLDAFRKPQALTLESSPETMHDAIRQKHATEIAERALSIVSSRFPESVGLVLQTYVSYSSKGMQSIEVFYAGEQISNEARNVLIDTLQKEMTLLKGNFQSFSIKRHGPLETDYACGKQFNQEELESEITELLNEVQNPEIKIQVTLDSNVPQEIEFTKLKGRINLKRSNLQCQARLRYILQR